MITLIKVSPDGTYLGSAYTLENTEHLYLEDGFVRGEPPTDSSMCLVNDTWVLPLEIHKTRAVKKITTARNTAEGAGFMAFGKRFDSDPSSIQRISIAAQAAQAIGPTFSIEWTCMDNSVITLDYAQMLALPAIMASVANNLHIQARTLKAQIESAETEGEVVSVEWTNPNEPGTTKEDSRL